MGREAYGLWMVTLSILSVLSLLDAGLAPAAKNRMSEAFARGDRDEFERYASGMLVAGFAVGCLGVLVVSAVALVDWGAILSLQEAKAAAQATGLIVSACAVAVASFAVGGVEAIYAAKLRTQIPATANTVASILSVALVYAFTTLRLGLWALPLATGGPLVVGRILLLGALASKGEILLAPAIRQIPGLLRELAPSSAAFISLQATNVALSAFPNVLIARQLGISGVAVFSIAQRLVSVPLLLVAAAVPAYWPAFTVAWSRGDMGYVKRTLRLTLTLTASMLLAYVLVMCVWGESLALMWTRKAVGPDRSLLCALGAWLVLAGCTQWLSTFLNAIADLRAQLAAGTIQVALLWVGGVALTTRYGAVGLASAMTLALAFSSTIPLGLKVRGRMRDGNLAGGRG